MKVTLSSSSLASFAIAIAMMAGPARALESWDTMTDAKLPKPVSDHSATFVPGVPGTATPDGIYIAGGCDSPNGNTYVDATGLELDFFLCESISDEVHRFDPTTGTFRTSPSRMPRGRYRHAAVAALGKLWLVGGRTIPEDTIIAEVDVSIVYHRNRTIAFTRCLDRRHRKFLSHAIFYFGFVCSPSSR